MAPSAPSGDWARRAARVGRCVARFRLANRPHVQSWQMSRVTSGGSRCVGCEEEFQPGESHVEVIVAQTVLMELHDECFDVWTRFTQGGRGPTVPSPLPAGDEAEDDV